MLCIDGTRNLLLINAVQYVAYVTDGMVNGGLEDVKTINLKKVLKLTATVV